MPCGSSERVFAFLCRIVGALTVAAFLIAAFTPAANRFGRWMATASDLAPSDAIVVLGASARGGTLSDPSMRRAVAGIQLYREGLAPRIIMMGLGGEGPIRAKLASSLGVQADEIAVEDEEPTTRDEAGRIGQLMRQQGKRSVLLVTDVIHMKRAKRLFEQQELTVHPVPTNVGLLRAESAGGRLTLTRTLAFELVALGYHRLFGYLR